MTTTDLEASISLLARGFSTWSRFSRNGIVRVSVLDNLSSMPDWKTAYPPTLRLLFQPDHTTVVLGTGRYSKVYRTGSHAFKVAKFRSTSETRCNLRELVFLHSLDHPNVLRPLQSQIVMVHGSIASVVHQLPVARCTLADYAMSTLDDVARVLVGVLQGLRYFHTNGMVHGDVKPDNILVMPEGRVVLADLSVSAFLCDDDCLVPAGSLYWRPPECLQGNRYTRASDIWSLGVAVLDCLHRCVYFRDRRHVTTSAELRRALAQGPLLQQDHWALVGSSNDTRQCRDFLQSMLRLHPAQRQTADGLLQHPFLERRQQPYTPADEPVLTLATQRKVLLARMNTILVHRGLSFHRTHLYKVCSEVHEFLWGCKSPPSDNLFYAGLYHVLCLLGYTLLRDEQPSRGDKTD